MHLIRRHGAPLAVVAGISLFAAALGGLTGIDRRLQAAVTSPSATNARAMPSTPVPIPVSDARRSGGCAPGGPGEAPAGRERSPHDRQEA
jgi:hypothetical protein